MNTAISELLIDIKVRIKQEYQREYSAIYRSNPINHKKDMDRKAATLAKKKRFLDTYFDKRCAICKARMDYLEFDHIDPSTKRFAIAGQMYKKLDKWVCELLKCQLLCIDCHKEKTLRERNLKEVVHGTANMYTHYKCRCDLCSKAYRISRGRE